MATYTVTFTGLNGPGAISTPGTKVGNKVIDTICTSADGFSRWGAGTFEDTITVQDQIQQTYTNDQSGNTWVAVIDDGLAGGSGSVTSVATGTGLTGGPVTTTGTISLANTAVTPGAYTLANVTVDQQGRITAAANGTPVPGGSDLQVQFNNDGALGGFDFSGDATLNPDTGVFTLASTIAAAGPIGSATAVAQITYDAKGRLTTVTSVPITPSWASITGTPTTLAGYGISSPLPGAQGGTGVANTGFSITLGGNLTTSGAFNSTFSVSGSNTYTLPNTSDTFAMLGASNIFSAAQTISLAGTLANPALVFSNAGTNTGWLAPGANQLELSVGGSNVLDFGVTTASRFNISNSTQFSLGANYAILLTNNAGGISFRGSAVTSITAPATSTIQLGPANTAAPANQSLWTQGSRAGTDTNVAGGSLTIQSGTGTGNATPSKLILQSPVAIASGASAQTQTTGLTINNGSAILSNYTVANLPSASVCGAGATAFVTDASTTLVLGLGGTVAGGGANKAPVYSDGTNWLYG